MAPPFFPPGWKRYRQFVGFARRDEGDERYIERLPALVRVAVVDNFVSIQIAKLTGSIYTKFICKNLHTHVRARVAVQSYFTSIVPKT